MRLVDGLGVLKRRRLFGSGTVGNTPRPKDSSLVADVAAWLVEAWLVEAWLVEAWLVEAWLVEAWLVLTAAFLVCAGALLFWDYKRIKWFK
jgi:hypothetical protein